MIRFTAFRKNLSYVAMIAMNEKANRGKILAVVAVLAMVLCAFVALTPADTDAAANEQSYSGTLDTEQTFPANTNVVINDDTTITSTTKDDKTTTGIMTVQGNLRVAEGVTLTIEKGASLKVEGGYFQVDGEIIVTGEGSKISVAGAEDIDYKTKGVVVNGSITVTKGASFGTTGEEDGKILINNGGSVEVSRSGTNVAKINGLNVDIAVGGTFSFEGAVTEPMTVSAYGTVSGETLKSVSSVTITRSGNYDSKDLSKLTFTSTSKNVTGYYESGEDVDTKLVREFALNVNGTVADNDTVTFNGRIYNADGTVYSTPVLYTSEDAAKADNSEKFDSIVSAKVIVGELTISETGNMVNNTYVQVTTSLTVDANTDDKKIGTLTLNEGSVLELVGELNVDYVVKTAAVENEGEIVTPAVMNLVGNGVIAVNGGSATITGADTGDADDLNIFGAYYANTSGTNDVLYISDLAAAIDGAVAAGEEEVYVSSAGADNKFDAYTITVNDSIPTDIELNVVDVLAVAEGVTLTFEVDSTATIGTEIYVDGTIVDNGLDLEASENQMTFQVKIVSDDEETNTYTSLANALAITESGTIYLYNDVEVSGTLIIKQNVTVQFSSDDSAKSDAKITFKDKNSVLAVDGTLIVDGDHKIVLAVTGTQDNGKVQVGNMIVTDINGQNIVGEIAGAHFDADLDNDLGERHYIAAVDVAAANSTSTEEIIIIGDVSMGAVTFTKGEDASGLTIVIQNDGNTENGKQLATGDITLAAGAAFKATGVYTGSVTDGTNTVQLSKSYGAEISFDSEETAEGTVTEMVLEGTVAGETTIAAGTVSIDDATLSDLTVAANATAKVIGAVVINAANPNTLLIAKEFPVYTEDSLRNIFASLFVEGTLDVVQGGSVDAAMAVIDGTVNIAERAGTVSIDGAYIAGTVNNEAPSAVIIGIAGVAGTITGDIDSDALIAYPGCTVADEDINGGQNDEKTTTYYINGEEYATVYAKGTVPMGAILIVADVSGVQIDTSVFYSDAAMTQTIAGVYNTLDGKFPTITGLGIADLIKLFSSEISVGTYENVYIAMDPAEVEGTVSVGTGLDLYIDNVRVTGGQDFVLSVGTHTVSFDVKAGYDGANATITFNGQTVQNGGSITITADMTEYTLVASGAAPSQGQVVIDQSGGDDGMGITDYLLIILVILVIVLAIFVALRMMRS